MVLRFGNSRASEDILALVERKFEDVVHSIGALKGRTFDELILLDVGMRAVMSAFGGGKEIFDDDRKKTVSWKEYSEWFTPQLNAIYQEGWFRSYSSLDQVRRSLLPHVVYDPSGAIINYKVETVPKALGALLTILIFVSGRASLDDSSIERVWEDSSEELRVPLRSGYRKQYRAVLQDEFQGTPKEFKEAVQKKANAAVERHIEKLRKYLKLE